MCILYILVILSEYSLQACIVHICHINLIAYIANLYILHFAKTFNVWSMSKVLNRNNILSATALFPYHDPSA